MSLIHDALRGESHPVAGVPAMVRERQPRHMAWLAVGVVLAGPLGFLAARDGQPQTMTADSVPSMIIMPTTAVLTTPPRAAARVAPPVRFASLPAIVLANAQPLAPDAAASPVDAPGPVQSPPPAATTPPPAATTPPPARTAPPALTINVAPTHSATHMATTAANTEEPDPVQVRAVMTRLQAAVTDGDAGTRDQALAQLQAILSADSLTLLRARAWAAHGSGDIARAEHYYRAILQRMPDDEHAGVNLALIDARRGDMDDARERLARMAARNSRSLMVSQALDELGSRQQ